MLIQEVFCSCIGLASGNEVLLVRACKWPISVSGSPERFVLIGLLYIGCRLVIDDVENKSKNYLVVELGDGYF